MSVRFRVHETIDGHLQLEIGDGHGGFRLAGPKFDGSSEVRLRSQPLDARDISEIRRYLDSAEVDLVECAREALAEEAEKSRAMAGVLYQNTGDKQ